jgi:tetratricopeptide (TPR) repeat protein/TolB-like protein
LAKDPVERYQSMNDLVVDLRSVRRRLESGSLSHPAESVAPARSSPKRPWLFVAGVAAAVALLVAGLVVFLRPGPEAEPVEAARPSVAVLYFENTTGEPSLDWLRTGLTDMLVTDLSQSPQLEVLSTDRLYHILSELNREDERITSLDVVQEVADRAGVETVILGSFMKAGESIRINIRVQEARSGKILSSEKVEGVGEANLFPMVDDLTRRIKTNFEDSTADTELDLDLKDVTTSSIEAYRYYVEGLRLHNRGKAEEAIPLLEKALEFDSAFAMALAKLAIVHGNLFHRAESDQYAERALEHVSRLTPRERYYIEGLYYDRQPETHELSIEAYKKALELDPKHASARHNLARRYLLDERYQDAIPHFEELRRQGMTFPDTYAQLATAYAAGGELEKGRSILQEFGEQYPENAAGHRNLAGHAILSGNLEKALEFYEKAETLEPGSPDAATGRWTLYSLREQWEEAKAEVEPLTTSTDPSRKWMGKLYLATGRLYRGRLEEALAIWKESVNVFPQPGPFSAIARAYVAEALLIKGEAGAALDMANKALEESDRTFPQQRNLRMAALAAANLGQWENAERIAAEYKRRAESLTPVSWEREAHRLAGELALARGDAAEAISRLEQAVSLLSQRGALPPPPPPHAPIWYSLASAYMAAGGQEDQAAEWFGRIIEGSVERNLRPVEYIRSFYFLAKIHENRGDADKAREYYRRFYEYWKDGDIDRERVEEARGKF